MEESMSKTSHEPSSLESKSDREDMVASSALLASVGDGGGAASAEDPKLIARFRDLAVQVYEERAYRRGLNTRRPFQDRCIVILPRNDGDLVEDIKERIPDWLANFPDNDTRIQNFGASRMLAYLHKPTAFRAPDVVLERDTDDEEGMKSRSFEVVYEKSVDPA
jgi:hypothetical protein